MVLTTSLSKLANKSPYRSERNTITGRMVTQSEQILQINLSVFVGPEDHARKWIEPKIKIRGNIEKERSDVATLCRGSLAGFVATEGIVVDTFWDDG